MEKEMTDHGVLLFDDGFATCTSTSNMITSNFNIVNYNLQNMLS